MDYSQLFNDIQDYFKDESWTVQMFAIVLVTLLIDWMQKRILRKLRVKSDKTKTFWDDALIESAGKPLSALIWLIGITFAAAIIFETVDPFRETGVIIILTWFLVRFVRRAEGYILEIRLQMGEPFDRTTVDVIAKLLRISIIIISSLVILQNSGYSISGVLAFGGIGGIVIGFAAKDLLANFFGGLMIYLDRPFEVGDWIRSPDREIEGTVEDIGWRLTRIRTFDKRPLYLPNAVFTSIAVENPSRMTNRRIYETIGLRYDDVGRMPGIIDDVKKMLREHPEIDVNQTMIVNFNEFAPSSLDFFVYTFTRTSDWVRFHEIKQDVMLKIMTIIEQRGAECAFPTSTIYMAGEN